MYRKIDQLGIICNLTKMFLLMYQDKFRLGMEYHEYFQLDKNAQLCMLWVLLTQLSCNSIPRDMVSKLAILVEHYRYQQGIEFNKVPLQGSKSQDRMVILS